MNALAQIILADDHQLVTDGLRMLLSTRPEWTVKGEARNGADLLALLDNTPCDLIITDLSMPGMRGTDLIKNIKAQHPEIPVLVLTMHDEQEIVQEILLSEAEGYLLKNSGKEEVLLAVDNLLNGKTHYASSLLVNLLQDYKQSKRQEESIKPLSPRELEILQLIVAEYNSREIADKLFISKQTVDTHRNHIMEKTGSKTLVGLIKYAILNNISG
ncbi:MAG: response regulator [Flavobacteriales bacterium]